MFCFKSGNCIRLGDPHFFGVQQHVKTGIKACPTIAQDSILFYISLIVYHQWDIDQWVE